MKKIKNIRFESRMPKDQPVAIRMERRGDDILVIVEPLTARVMTPEEARELEQAGRAPNGQAS